MEIIGTITIPPDTTYLKRDGMTQSDVKIWIKPGRYDVVRPSDGGSLISVALPSWDKCARSTILVLAAHVGQRHRLAAALRLPGATIELKEDQ